MMILSPAYGRDYKNRNAVIRSFIANKDFIIENFDHPYSGKPVNRSQLVEAGESKVQFRYNNLKSTFVLSINLENVRK